MTVSTVDLRTLQQDISKEFGYGQGICSAAGSTTTIVDTSADSPMDPDDDSELYRNAWIMIEADSAGTPLNLGEVLRVSTYSPSAQTLTMRGVLTNATTTTQTYGIYHGLPPKRLGSVKGTLEYVNEVLRESYFKTHTLLTEAADGDMEATGTTNFANTGTPTLSKSTTLATGGFLGSQALKVIGGVAVNSSADQTFQVRGSETWHVSVDVYQGTADQAALYVTDNGGTPSTGIVTATANQLRFQRLHLSITTASDATQLTVKLRSVAASDTLYWDNLSVRRAQQNWIALPSWVNAKDWIEELEFWMPGSSHGTGMGNLDDMRRDRVQWWKVVEDYTGVTPYRVEFWPPAPRSDTQIMIRGIRPFSALVGTSSGANANADTTTANRDMVKSLALARIYIDKGDKEKAARWAAEGQQLAARYSAQVAKRMQLAEPV